MSDNYHQPVLGGTGPDSQPLGFADQVFFSDGKGNPATPPANRIYNPDPQAGTLNLYTLRADWFNCSDPSQPGISAITNYLSKLPYALDTKCGPGQFWQAVNVNPAFTPKGAVQTGLVVPQTMQRSIGDVLSANNIPGNIMAAVLTPMEPPVRSTGVTAIYATRSSMKPPIPAWWRITCGTSLIFSPI